MDRLLMQAASKNDRTLLEEIVKGQHGEVEQEGLDQAMIRASGCGNTGCVSILLDHGADPLAVDMDGDTALMMTASNGYVSTLRLLLSKGSDVNLTSDRGRSALHMAVWSQQTKCVEILLKENCDPNIHDCYGDTPLLLCARKGYTDILGMLLMNGCMLDSVNSDKDNALHYAGRYGHADILSAMLTVPASYELLDDQNVWGKTALMYAAEFKHELCAELLISAGSHIFLTDTSQRTALHYATKSGLYKCSRFLVERGADLDILDSDCGSPLIYAVAANRINIVQVLIQNGCNVNVMGLCGVQEQYSWFMPVQIALGNRQFEIAKLLIAAGCELELDEVTLRLLKRAFPQTDENEDYVWFYRAFTQPRPLAHICRIAIKDLLKQELAEKAKLLPLPKSLQSFVAFCDI